MSVSGEPREGRRGLQKMIELMEVEDMSFLIRCTNWDLYSQCNGKAYLKRMGIFCLGL